MTWPIYSWRRRMPIRGSYIIMILPRSQYYTFHTDRAMYIGTSAEYRPMYSLGSLLNSVFMEHIKVHYVLSQCACICGCVHRIFFTFLHHTARITHTTKAYRSGPVVSWSAVWITICQGTGPSPPSFILQTIGMCLSSFWDYQYICCMDIKRSHDCLSFIYIRYL